MKCREMEAPQIAEEIARFDGEPVYQPQAAAASRVEFRFDLQVPDPERARFGILSRRLDTFIYKGLYRYTITVPLDAGLTEDDGWDGLEFVLLQDNRICSASNERGYPFWRPGAQIGITFLQKPVFDEDGLYKQYDVTIGP